MSMCILCASMSAVAQQADSTHVFPQSRMPMGFDCYDFTAYYFNARKVYNTVGAMTGKASGDIVALAMNPSGTDYAVIYRKGRSARVQVFNRFESNGIPGEKLRMSGFAPKALAWSGDGNRLFVAGDDNSVRVYNAPDYTESDRIPLDFTGERLAADSRGRWLAVSSGNRVSVMALYDNTLRTEFGFEGKVNSIKFSEDGSALAVIVSGGVLTVYDTQSWQSVHNVDALGDGMDVSIHPDGKYVAAITGGSRIAVVNVLDTEDRQYIDLESGGVTALDFVTEKDGKVYLLYNTSSALVYEPMDNLTPYYTRLLRQEVDARMEEWMRQMPGESLEDYRLRVNEDTKMEQMRLFEQEIATRMADNRLQASTVTLDNFNTRTNKLEVNFDNMPSIYLDVPSDEVNDFMDPGKLEFRNTLYGLDDRDNFEVIYTEVYNPQSGKTYTFDNRSRESLDYLAYDEGIVPLELVQMSNMEEMRLQEIKDEVISSSLERNIISDHTQIAVSTGIVPAVDENGEKIVNYQVGFSYNVEKGFSEREDFAPGQYRTDNSGAAMSLARIIENAFSGEFAQYIVPGRRLVVTITGMADRLRINGRIAYDGSYGEFENIEVNGADGPFRLTVTSETGITENDQLALVRAAGIKNYISRHVEQLDSMDVEYRYNIVISDEVGGEHRRISVDFLFVDVF